VYPLRETGGRSSSQVLSTPCSTTALDTPLPVGRLISTIPACKVTSVHGVEPLISTIPACKVTSVHGVEPLQQPIMTDIASVARQPMRNVAPMSHEALTQGGPPWEAASAPPPPLGPPPSNFGTDATGSVQDSSSHSSAMPTPTVPYSLSENPPSGVSGTEESTGRVGYWKNVWIAPHLRLCSRLPISAAAATPTGKRARVSLWNARAVAFAPGVASAHGPVSPTSSVNVPFGGLRNLAPTIRRLPHAAALGSRIYAAMSEMLEKHPGMIEEALAAVGKKNLTTLDRQTVARTQECLFSVLNTALPCFDPTPQTQDCVINLPLLEHWQRAAKDPDDAAVDWLLHGAPAGIINPIPDRGIFPQYAPEDDIAEVAADDLATDMHFSNYTGVEGDAEVRAEFDRLAAKSYTREFCSLREAEAYVRGKIVLSKIGVIRRWRNLAWKLRMVVDSKASGISRSTRKFERTMLPRALDVVLDTLELMDLAHRDRAEGLDSGIEYLIADFRDAFYLVPNHPAERKFFCVKLGNKYIVFTKTAQGSRGAALTWARIAALVTRLTQTVIGIQRTRMSTYVDDPIVVAVGSAKFRKDTFARVLLIWSALQLPLAFD